MFITVTLDYHFHFVRAVHSLCVFLQASVACRSELEIKQRYEIFTKSLWPQHRHLQDDALSFFFPRCSILHMFFSRCSILHMFFFILVFFFGWFFGPVDARETCFGPCVAACQLDVHHFQACWQLTNDQKRETHLCLHERRPFGARMGIYFVPVGQSFCIIPCSLGTCAKGRCPRPHYIVPVTFVKRLCLNGAPRPCTRPVYCYLQDQGDAAYNMSVSNFIQTVRSTKTAKGFGSNYGAGGSKSVDRTEPPMAARVLKALYTKYKSSPENNLMWVVKLVMQDLLDWQDWILEARVLQPLGAPPDSFPALSPVYAPYANPC